MRMYKTESVWTALERKDEKTCPNYSTLTKSCCLVELLENDRKSEKEEEKTTNETRQACSTSSGLRSTKQISSKLEI